VRAVMLLLVFGKCTVQVVVRTLTRFYGYPQSPEANVSVLK
jgi:hypothetical protein